MIVIVCCLFVCLFVCFWLVDCYCLVGLFALFVNLFDEEDNKTMTNKQQAMTNNMTNKQQAMTNKQQAMTNKQQAMTNNMTSLFVVVVVGRGGELMGNF